MEAEAVTLTTTVDLTSTLMEPTQQTGLQLSSELFDNLAQAMPQLLRIPAKGGGMVDFWPKEPQLRVLGLMRWQASHGQPVRVNILKPRKVGMSTLTLAIFFLILDTNPGVNALVLGYSDENTEYLNSIMVAIAQHYRRPDHAAAIKPGKRVIRFPNGSSARFMTAGGRQPGRGGTFQLVLLSEVAYYETVEGQSKTVAEAALSAMPEGGGYARHTIAVRESTADLVGTYWHKEWEASVTGKSEWAASFTPWNEDPDNRMTPPVGWEPDTADDEVPGLVRDYHINREQLFFREHMIRNAYQNDVSTFHGQYPITELQAFRVVGDCFFDRQILDKYRLAAREAKPTFRGSFPIPQNFAEHLEWSAVEDPTGELTIWKYPESGGHYRIGGDVGEGLAHGDYSVLDVLDAYSHEQVAQWRSNRHGPDEMAYIAHQLGMFYNKAWIGIEANALGIYPNSVLRDLEYPRQHVHEEVDNRVQHGRRTEKLGWLTHSRTRRYMLDTLNAELRKGEIGVNSLTTLGEMWIFAKSRTRREPAAPRGQHDDCVMTLAIALQMCVLHPPPAPVEKEVPVETMSARIRKAYEEEVWQDRLTEMRQNQNADPNWAGMAY